MEILDFILHIDKYLDLIAQQHGPLVYLILFLIIFSETGFVFTPFLPGDSLLFVVGSLAGKGSLNFWIVYFLLFTAAVFGNISNFFIGYFFGRKLIKHVKKDYIIQTENFFAKHGGKAVVISRFLPIFRTFIPFVAGIGKMDIYQFLFYNLVGGFLWVTFFVTLGYFTGNMPFIKENFSIFFYIIIISSILPGVLKIIFKK